MSWLISKMLIFFSNAIILCVCAHLLYIVLGPPPRATPTWLDLVGFGWILIFDNSGYSLEMRFRAFLSGNYFWGFKSLPLLDKKFHENILFFLRFFEKKCLITAFE